ncbi:hypothetical protein ACSBR2_011272 [Camellia fascicularis]
MNQSQSWIDETQLNFEHYKTPNFKLTTLFLIKTLQFRVHSKMAETGVPSTSQLRTLPPTRGPFVDRSSK